MLKEVMFRDIDGIRNEMTAMADDIFAIRRSGWRSFMRRKFLRTGWRRKASR